MIAPAPKKLPESDRAWREAARAALAELEQRTLPPAGLREIQQRGPYEGSPRVLATRCPRCDSLSGQPCTSWLGQVTYPHMARRIAAGEAYELS